MECCGLPWYSAVAASEHGLFWDEFSYIAFNPYNGVIMNRRSRLVRSYDMRTRILSIISIGISIGFLLGMGVIALLRSAMDGDTPELELAFTVMVAMMGGALVVYVIRTTR